MAFSYRLKQSVEIPLKDSPDNALERRVSDLCVDVWNLTQRWGLLNIKSSETVEKIINDRLRLVYSQRMVFMATNTAFVNEKSERLEEKAKFFLTSTVKMLSTSEKMEILRNLIRKSEKLSSELEEFSNIAGRFQAALTQLFALQKLCSRQLTFESLLFKKIQLLAKILPFINSMYQQELAAKSAAMTDLRQFDNRNVFLAIMASWNHEAFIDKNILSVLYSLII